MIKTRIVAVIIIKEGIAVQSIGFQHYLPIGRPEIAIHYLNSWGIDEIVILDITATANKIAPAIQPIQNYASHCQVPLAIGGGITQLSEIKQIIQAGADKVVLNSCLMTCPHIIEEAAKHFGNQSIVVSLDVKRESNGLFQVYTHSGKRATGFSPQELALRAQNLGAGELLLNSIDRDGKKQGYDLDLIQLIINSVDIPLTICGGMGHPIHMHEAIHYKVSGVAAANFFHFSEHSAITLKQYLQSLHDPIRLDSYTTYAEYKFDQSGRIHKKNDGQLESLRFQYIPEERI